MLIFLWYLQITILDDLDILFACTFPSTTANKSTFIIGITYVKQGCGLFSCWIYIHDIYNSIDISHNVFLCSCILSPLLNLWFHLDSSPLPYDRFLVMFLCCPGGFFLLSFILYILPFCVLCWRFFMGGRFFEDINAHKSNVYTYLNNQNNSNNIDYKGGGGGI